MKHFEGVKESFTAEGYQSACPNSLATTSLAMSRLYDGERYHDSDLHCEASNLASRLTEIARSWIEFLKDSATDDDMKKLVDNAILET